MLAEVAGFAVLAALSPTALLVIAVYLGSAQPKRTGSYYLAGALLMSVIMGVIVLAALDAGDLSHASQREPRYGLRLGIGVLALAVSAFMVARKPRPADPDKPGKGIVSRLIANPSPRTAFLVGVLVFTPSVTFIAAIQAIATSKASPELDAIALVIAVVLSALLVWLPMLTYLLVPGWTSRTLTAFNGWLRAHGRILAAIAAAVVGVILTVNGLIGLLK